MSQHCGVQMLHVYGFRRDGQRYFVSSVPSLEEGIQTGYAALQDRARRFVRAEVRDLRVHDVLWSRNVTDSRSEPLTASPRNEV